MENSNTELAGKTPAAITWLQTIGFVMLVISRLLYRQIDWLLYLAGVFLITSFLLRLYFDWKIGRKKAFRNRLIVLAIAIAAALVLTYFAIKKG